MPLLFLASGFWLLASGFWLLASGFWQKYTRAERITRYNDSHCFKSSFALYLAPGRVLQIHL
ncbi:MAG: hypothetical protein DSY80_07550 [Desulfocapsa sp.]|nr:MAG: hypothetical protein DSY80_07550 [Desulfocapsa sp.]